MGRPSPVLFEGPDHHVATITVPGDRWDRSAAAALIGAATGLVEDRGVRVVVVRADAPRFCTGGAEDLDPAGFDPDPAAALARLRPPVISVIRGRCASVGFEVVLATDIRVCGPDATFVLDDVATGRLPCWGGTQRLARAVRPAEATAMVLLGTELDAPRALSLGLVHAIADDPDAEAARLAGELGQRGPLALELAKEAVHRGAELPLRDGLRLEGDLNHQLAATDDRAEGLAAFFDKRPPDFAGR
ncbi:MAG: enoyl-CoA hydratase/isomerase family protein [Acidimicrobiales bacterium]